MQLLDKYLEFEKQVHEYFGYREDWVKIPIEDRREMHWQLMDPDQCDYSRGSVVYHEDRLTQESVLAGNCYEDEIYTQRFLPKWVYRGKDFTMICVNPRVDGNKFLAIYDNSKEQTDLGSGFRYAQC
jgi:hypothetical protein